jgi:glutathione synthase/RimK-type ligase-like ATP-grasp enzyme
MIGLVTYENAPALTDDDRPLIAELERLGVPSRPVIWDDPAERWSDYSTLVLRSPWNYHLKPAEFVEWLGVIEAAGVQLWNPYEVVRWNMHKRYMRDLEARGVLIADTEWIARAEPAPLSQVLARRGWTDAIIKPAISASATDTWRTTRDVGADGLRYRELVERADVLVQRTVPEVLSAGEWSLMFIDSTYSHGVIKRPAAGDFRVQTEKGGSAAPAVPPRTVVESAERIVAMIPAPCLYTRIDGVETSQGFMLMEVEAIEPLLFFAFEPRACAAMARALAARR